MERVEFALANLSGKIPDVWYSIGWIHSRFLEKFGKENIYGVEPQQVDFWVQGNAAQLASEEPSGTDDSKGSESCVKI